MSEVNVGETNRAVALKFIKAMGENDPVAAAECLAPDAVAVATGNSHFKGSRDARMMIDVRRAPHRLWHPRRQARIG